MDLELRLGPTKGAPLCRCLEAEVSSPLKQSCARSTPPSQERTSALLAVEEELDSPSSGESGAHAGKRCEGPACVTEQVGPGTDVGGGVVTQVGAASDDAKHTKDDAWGDAEAEAESPPRSLQEVLREAKGRQCGGRPGETQEPECKREVGYGGDEAQETEFQGQQGERVSGNGSGRADAVARRQQACASRAAGCRSGDKLGTPAESSTCRDAAGGRCHVSNGTTAADAGHSEAEESVGESPGHKRGKREESGARERQKRHSPGPSAWDLRPGKAGTPHGVQELLLPPSSGAMHLQNPEDTDRDFWGLTTTGELAAAGVAGYSPAAHDKSCTFLAGPSSPQAAVPGPVPVPRHLSFQRAERVQETAIGVPLHEATAAARRAAQGGGPGLVVQPWSRGSYDASKNFPVKKRSAALFTSAATLKQGSEPPFRGVDQGARAPGELCEGALPNASQVAELAEPEQGSAHHAVVTPREDSKAVPCRLGIQGPPHPHSFPYGPAATRLEHPMPPAADEPKPGLVPQSRESLAPRAEGLGLWVTPAPMGSKRGSPACEQSLEGQPHRAKLRGIRKGSFHRFDSDGHVWNKYSHKRLRNSRTERSYYACAERDSLGCSAKKLVDRPQREKAHGDHSCDVVTLEGEHNHPPLRAPGGRGIVFGNHGHSPEAGPLQHHAPPHPDSTWQK